MLKLAKPTTITPIKLIRPKELGLLKYGTELLIAGYGLTSAKNQGSSGTKYYATTTLAAVGQSELLLGGKGQPQTCSGDSGGPTLVDASGSEDWRLVGVTSRGDQSCLLESVDTRVDSFLSWIHSAGTIPCGSGLSADCETAPTPPTPPQTPPTPPTEPPAPAPTPAPAPAPTPAPTPAKKALGESCAANADCTSGLCAEADGARFCTQLCDPSVGCPASGMVCASAGEELHACAPAAPEAEAFNGDEATGGCTLAARPVAARGLGLLLAALLLGLALLRRSR